jgi:hypothetical protein
LLFRLIVVASTVALITLPAGSLNTAVGGINGLTSADIASGCAAPNGPNFKGCVTGSLDTFSESSYTSVLFSGTTGISKPPPTGNTPGGVTLADNRGIPFSLVNEASIHPASLLNYWGASGNDGGIFGTLTIPVGISGQEWVALMFDNQWGVAGNVNAFVQLDFGTASNLADAGSLDFAVVNGFDVRAATDCIGAAACSQYARTVTSANTANIWTATYAGNSGPAPYGGTSGQLNLDDIFLAIDSSHIPYYLVDVQFSDFGGGQNVSRTGISAITVGTPEPPTFLLIAAALLPLARRRFTRSPEIRLSEAVA